MARLDELAAKLIELEAKPLPTAQDKQAIKVLRGSPGVAERADRQKSFVGPTVTTPQVPQVPGVTVPDFGGGPPVVPGQGLQGPGLPGLPPSGPNFRTSPGVTPFSGVQGPRDPQPLVVPGTGPFPPGVTPSAFDRLIGSANLDFLHPQAQPPVVPGTGPFPPGGLDLDVGALGGLGTQGEPASTIPQQSPVDPAIDEAAEEAAATKGGSLKRFLKAMLPSLLAGGVGAAAGALSGRGSVATAQAGLAAASGFGKGKIDEENRQEMARLEQFKADTERLKATGKGVGKKLTPFQTRLNKVTDDIDKELVDGKITSNQAVDRIERVYAQFERELTDIKRANLISDFAQFTMRVTFGDTTKRDLTRMTAIQSGIEKVRLKLRDPVIQEQIGKVGGIVTLIDQWLTGGASPEVEEFLTELGLSKDMLIRLQTGAAVNEAEDKLFDALVGGTTTDPAAMDARLGAIQVLMNDRRRAAYETVIVTKFSGPDDAEELERARGLIPQFTSKVTGKVPSTLGGGTPAAPALTPEEQGLLDSDPSTLTPEQRQALEALLERMGV